MTRIAEGLNLAVLDSLERGLPARTGSGALQLTRNITGLVYKTVHQLSQLAGTGTDLALRGVEALLGPPGEGQAQSVHRETALAILNGLIGDRLLAEDNPLALAMQMHHADRVLELNKPCALPGASGKVLLQVHGLCMRDMRRPGSALRGHEEPLVTDLGYTAVSLRYNTGLHVSHNGRELAAQLERLLQQWPVEVEELTILAHSMGGLVARSAVHHARQQSLQWPDHLKNIVFLGTPHHGAPLERAGHWVDALLRISPYTRPFGALGRLRSSGITDLRHGNVLEEGGSDVRSVVPLPHGVACFTVAAMSSRRSNRAGRWMGDGLVPVQSALGQHSDSRRDLKFDPAACHIAQGVNHMGLLSDPGVQKQIMRWLATEQGQDQRIS